MIDKFFSVSPSPNDIKGDLKSAERLKPELSDNYKKDFESYLNKNEPRGIKKKDSDKLVKKNKDSDDKIGEEKKVVKKKKIDVNEEAALAIMASNESVTEVPEIEKNLDFADGEYQNKNESISTSLFPEEKRSFNAIEEQALLDLSGTDQESDISEQVDTDNEVTIFENEGHLSFEDKVKLSLSQDAQDLQFQESISASLDDSGFSTDSKNAEVSSSGKDLINSLSQDQIKGVTESRSESETEFDANDSAQSELPHQFHVADAKAHATDFSASMASGVNQTDDKPVVDKATQLESLKEVYNQAQYLVKKGGGEMSVQMTPEGMGTVHLKVALDNGQLQLEINTSDKSVKKLIEEHLSDLKSSLALQHMTVEHVKINTVAETNTDNQTQFDFKQDSKQNHNAFESGQGTQDGRQSADKQRRLFPDSQSLTPQVSLNTVKRAAANRVYQSHKANSLNAVA